MSKNKGYLSLLEEEIPYEIIRTKRKSIGIQLSQDKKITIRAPQNVSDSVILEVLETRKPWLYQKLNRIKKVLPTVLVHTQDITRIKVRYRNKYYPMKVHPLSDSKGHEQVVFVGGVFYLYLEPHINGQYTEESLRPLLVKFMRKRAKEIITDKITKFVKLIGVNQEEILIKGFDDKWGNCTQDGKLEFNWRIILGPDRAVDYVIIHELCHLLELNHSAKFWNLMEKFMPDYMKWKDWLLIHGNELVVFHE